jgi:TatA/E family protein of Tat protein translocase
MFGLGHAPELILVLVIALIVLGPGKIPEVAQMLGKAIRELRQASADLQKTFDVNELVNLSPPPPAAHSAGGSPPAAGEWEADAKPAIAAGAEAIAPPAMMEAAAKAKRPRKRPSGSGTQDSAGSVQASNGASPPGQNGAAPAKASAGRRSSKKTAEPVSIDAAV